MHSGKPFGGTCGSDTGKRRIEHNFADRGCIAQSGVPAGGKIVKVVGPFVLVVIVCTIVVVIVERHHISLDIDDGVCFRSPYTLHSCHDEA